MLELKINERFRDACPDLSKDEFSSLENLILKDGKIFNPILIWNDIIIDGHNRYLIAKLHNIDFNTENISFESDEDAIAWIKESAISRRNLNDYQRSKLVLDLEDYYKVKAKERQIRKPESVVPILAPQNETGKVRDELAQKAGVSHGTIDKVKKIVAEASEEIKEQVEAGEISINKAFNETKKSFAEAEKLFNEFDPEINILETAASGLERWVSRHTYELVMCEFVPVVKELIEQIRDKKATYGKEIY